MTNRSEDPKALLTRLRILKAIEKPIDKCTVDEICSKAGVSRQTFYSMFDSKYAVVSWWSECSEKLFLDRIGTKYSWEEGTYRHIRFLFSKIHILSSALALSSEEVQREVSLRRKARMMNVLRERGIEVDDLLSFCVDSYAYELTKAATSYVNVPESRRAGLVLTAKELVSIVPAPLYDALKLPGQTKRTQMEGIAEMGAIAERISNEPETDLFELLLDGGLG